MGSIILSFNQALTLKGGAGVEQEALQTGASAN
jgi:hypothetical protein